MAALVAALLIRATDPSSVFVSSTAEGTDKSAAVLVGAVVALCITQALGAVIGTLLSPHLTPDSARLLVGCALIAAGSTPLWPTKPTDRGATRRPLVGTAMLLVTAGLGDRTQVATIAIAAGGDPALAAIGGLIGGFVVLAIAATTGASGWRALPNRTARVSIRIVLVATGFWLALAALGLL